MFDVVCCCSLFVVILLLFIAAVVGVVLVDVVDFNVVVSCWLLMLLLC